MLCVLAVCLVLLLHRSKIPHSLYDQDTHIKIHTVFHFWGVIWPGGFTSCVLDHSSMRIEGNVGVCVYADTCEQVCKDAGDT